MIPTVDQVVERIAAWRGRAVTVTPLSGGRTNAIYRAEVDGEPYVIRIPGIATELLAVDRENECHNTLAAAAAGVGPRVVQFFPDTQVMVLEFVRGTTMTVSGLQAPGMPTRMAEVLRRLHAGPRFRRDFDMFRLTEFYLRVAAERAVPLPADYRRCHADVARIEAAFARHPLPSVPCHNDLLAENYIDDGRRLWLIDFEYSGNNDPTFELGNTCQEQQFDPPRVAELCAAYFGAAEPDKRARVYLNMIMSDVGWTLWAAIQAQVSQIDYDFAGWARERWARARTKLTAPEFEAWLAAV